MKYFRLALVSVSLLASQACDRYVAQAKKTVFVPWEEGLTLIYENPVESPSKGTQGRLQVRVASSKEAPEGRTIGITYTTFQGQMNADFLNKEGGWVLKTAGKSFTILPEGFPDRVNTWGDPNRGMTCRIIGRASLMNSDLKLPDDFDRTGIWVESESMQGTKSRTFFLPNIGEVQRTELNKDGQWVLVNQLVSRGFTDAPVVKSDKQ